MLTHGEHPTGFTLVEVGVIGQPLLVFEAERLKILLAHSCLDYVRFVRRGGEAWTT